MVVLLGVLTFGYPVLFLEPSVYLITARTVDGVRRLQA